MSGTYYIRNPVQRTDIIDAAQAQADITQRSQSIHTLQSVEGVEMLWAIETVEPDPSSPHSRGGLL